ncbi:MAG TPA: hypothetical protein VFU37_02025, partial [Pyrinomonadaceae bacterium]|nr:hypothetical protein [Pyrinomonadaceae bacterium]
GPHARSMSASLVPFLGHALSPIGDTGSDLAGELWAPLAQYLVLPLHFEKAGKTSTLEALVTTRY